MARRAAPGSRRPRASRRARLAAARPDAGGSRGRLRLPPPPLPTAQYVPAVAAAGLLFVSGQDPEAHGRLRYRGRVGGEVTRRQARAAARLAARNALAAAHATLGSLARVRRCAALTCFVDGAVFPDVAADALALVTRAFGRPPVLWLRPARGLAGGTPVEVELLLELAEP